jgi:hypothetical protein
MKEKNHPTYYPKAKVTCAVGASRLLKTLRF